MPGETGATGIPVQVIIDGITAHGSASVNKNPALDHDTVTVTASPHTGYHVSSVYTVPSFTVSGSGPWTFVVGVPPSSSFFTKIEVHVAFALTNYSIIKTVLPANSGTISGASTATYGSSVTLTPSPASGYQFSSWSSSDVTFSGNTFTMPAKDVGVIANFTKKSFAITVQSANTSMGTVTGGGTYQFQTAHAITATPKPGYKFKNWSMTGSGSIASTTSASTTFTVGAGTATVTATFEKQSYTLTVNSSDTSKGTVSGGGTYQYQASVAISASPKSLHRFSGWSKTSGEGTIASASSANTTFTIGAGNAVVKGNFERIYKTVKYWTGSAWQECEVWYWDGSAWKECEIWYWTGSAWQECSHQNY